MFGWSAKVADEPPNGSTAINIPGARKSTSSSGLFNSVEDFNDQGIFSIGRRTVSKDSLECMFL